MIFHESLEWETGDEWEKAVCEPVVKYPMAPREAKMILEIAGGLMADGIPASRIAIAMASLKPDSRIIADEVHGVLCAMMGDISTEDVDKFRQFLAGLENGGE